MPRKPKDLDREELEAELRRLGWRPDEFDPLGGDYWHRPPHGLHLPLVNYPTNRAHHGRRWRRRQRRRAHTALRDWPRADRFGAAAEPGLARGSAMMRCTKCGAAIAQGWEVTRDGRDYHTGCDPMGKMEEAKPGYHPHTKIAIDSESVPGVAADRVMFDPPVRVPIGSRGKAEPVVTDVERVFEVTVQGPELAACFTNNDGEEFRLSVNVVIDQWPPSVVQLRLEGPNGLDDTATYAKAEEAKAEDEQGAAG